jgi:hypothetical protein
MAQILTIIRETCGVLAIVCALCAALVLVVLVTEINKIGKIKRNTHLNKEDMDYLLGSQASDIYERWKGTRIILTATAFLGTIYLLLAQTKP